MSDPNRLRFSRMVLAADALTCAAAGALLLLGAGALQGPLGLPAPLLAGAGLVLLPVAAFFAWLARSSAARPGLILLGAAGNVLWAGGSAAVLLLAHPTPLGAAFVIVQALVVALLAALETRAAVMMRSPVALQG